MSSLQLYTLSLHALTTLPYYYYYYYYYYYLCYVKMYFTGRMLSNYVKELKVTAVRETL